MKNPIDTTHELVSYANSHRNKIAKVIINTGLLFVIFMIFGCFDFVNFSMDFSLLGNAKYWTSVITKTIGGSIAFNIGLNLLFDKEVDSDKQLEEKKNTYNALNKNKNELVFNKYVIEVFNPKQKKIAYKAYINRKIYWLNKFAKNKSKLLYSNGTEEEKAKDKYCIKRAELERLKSDEYIDKNIESIVIKYNQIDPIIFELELDGKSSYQGIKVKGNVNFGRSKLTGGVIGGMIGFSMLTTSIVLAPDQQEFANQMIRFWHYVLVCCEDIGIILWQTFRGMINARKLVSQELTEPLSGRVYVLQEYYKWIGDTATEETRGEALAMIVGGKPKERATQQEEGQA